MAGENDATSGALPGAPGQAARFLGTCLDVLAAITLFGMMMMTATDVAGRYLFSRPLGFAYEMTELGMAALVFCALPGVTARSGHVTVGLFENSFKGVAAALRDIGVALVSAIGCGFMSWRTLDLAQRLEQYGDRTSMLQVPIAPFTYAGSVAWGLAALAALGLAVLACRRLSGGAGEW